MPGVYEIRFLPSGRTREFCGSRGDYYEFADGSHIDVKSGPVWCYPCHDFKDDESIESLEEIEQQLSDLRDPRSELYRFTKDTISPAERRHRFRRSYIKSLRQRRRWREGREAPPKCLECGSTEIVVLPADGERVTNPTGPGWIEVTITGLCSTFFNNRFYTPEGDRIPRDTKPTYWSLP